MTNYVRERTAKIIEEVYNSTYIDKIETEVLEKILQDALIEYHNEVFTYGHNIGHDDGYTAGHKAGLDEAVDNAYDAGYSLGYDDGFSEGYSEGHAEVKTLLKMR